MTDDPTARYDDGSVRVDAEGLRIARYYFPLARPRRVAFAELRGYDRRSMGAWTGRYRGWGSHRPDWWFPLDRSRWRKREMLVLDVRGVKPVITPDDVDAVCALIDEGVVRGR